MAPIGMIVRSFADDDGFKGTGNWELEVLIQRFEPSEQLYFAGVLYTVVQWEKGNLQ